VNAGRWPHPYDDPTTIARKAALMYRARLGLADRKARDECDNILASYGQDWMLDRPQIVEPDAEVTTAEAADLVNVSKGVIRQWACKPHPEHPDRPLLPRAGFRGHDRTYKAVDVLAAAVAVRRARQSRPSTR
jgi:hypothetical protein